ncbi:Alpha/beta hydrolase family-domain-containing protein [Suillus subalutaceus]|uniref:Alpha/beta hydrolase family-domain-containing protein n=1 Tax=Suillus subalutaceus TaxID=48586 RepID=UPI001B86670B|nr:Alpha/beta hydrolase family-domain-containing protein [Suillus subalutaceus]KAG1872917.1 Alpha/beta hydrolase family-domain-containing protein [Suillus subalutaceus]
MTSSYPYTPTTLRTTVKPRPWVPFKPHEGHVEVPPLPFKPRSDDLLGTYNISTHIILAANPRVTPNIPVPEPPPRSSKRTESDIKNLGLELMEQQARLGEEGYSGVTDERLLWNCVNRYVKKTRRPKSERRGSPCSLCTQRIWETHLCYLLAACGAIDEIWSWESVQHGDSALLNRHNLSGSSDWTDNARDITNFLINYMPEEVETSSLPIQLNRVPVSIGESREKSGFSSRTLVVAGHSFGGCSVTLAALHFPALFSSIILVDAVIDTYQGPMWELMQAFVGATLIRRDQWPSREDALRSFKSSPLFSAWHPDVLRLYVDFGLYEDESGCVRLKMPPVHEALVLANPRARREAWELMEKLDEKIELLWILPGKDILDMSISEVIKQRPWRRPANSSNIIFKSTGHLIPQESPEELARVMADFLHRKYDICSGKSKL